MISFRLLLENRIDFLRNYYYSKKKIGNKVASFDKLFSADPTNKKLYLQWLINQSTSGKLWDEDLYKVTDALIIYERLKSKFKHKDINQYKEYRDLIDEADSLSGVKTSGELKRDEWSEALREAEIRYKGPEGTIIIPKTEKSSCILGRGTKWCTASEKNNQFSYYNRKGSLYIIMTKDGRKYQFQLESGQLMNEKDREVKFENFDKKYQWVFNKIKFTEQEQLKAVSKDGYAIRFIKNPSEAVQLAAVSEDGI